MVFSSYVDKSGLYSLLNAQCAWVFARPACILIDPYPMSSLYVILITQYFIPWVLMRWD